jgi:hypothetical protein
MGFNMSPVASCGKFSKQAVEKRMTDAGVADALNDVFTI